MNSDIFKLIKEKVREGCRLGGSIGGKMGCKIGKSRGGKNSNKNGKMFGNRNARKYRKRLWDRKYDELVRFQREYRHCMVTQREGSLGQWVTRERRRYREGTLSRRRVRKLDRIGFVWNPRQGEDY